MAIDEAAMPEEPTVLRVMREGKNVPQVLDYIDALKLHAQQSAEALADRTKDWEAVCAGAGHLREELESAESRLREVEARTVLRCIEAAENEHLECYLKPYAHVEDKAYDRGVKDAVNAIRALPIGHTEEK